MMKITATPRYQCNLIFYETTRIMFLIGKYVGLMPIEGLKYTSHRLRFTWRSPGFLFIFLPSLIMQTTTGTFFFFASVHTEFKTPKLAEMTFWATCFTSFIYYVKLSVNLQNMLKKIEHIEMSLPPQDDIRDLTRKKYSVLLFYGLVGTAEHLLHLAMTYIAVRQCFNLPEDSGLYLKSYFSLGFEFVFRYIPFNYVQGFMLQFVKLQTTVYWSFNDALFLICTVYLESKFDSFNRILFRWKSRPKKEPLDWADLQFQYTQLSKLVRIIDDHISPVICVTFMTSFLLLCHQLFIIIGDQIRLAFYKYYDCYEKYSYTSWLKFASLYMSTVFMASRILLVLSFAARLHTASKKPLKIIGHIPSEYYNRETLRFMNQVYYSNVALSGYNLFYFTRDTIITVVGVIATYELVLFQI